MDGIEEEEENQEEEEEEEEEDDEIDQANSPFEGDLSSSETNSPKRKRARTTKLYSLPVEYANITATKTPITFDAFEELPIRARSKSAWNLLLKKNPDFWTTKCEKWCRQLQEAFDARDDVSTFFIP